MKIMLQKPVPCHVHLCNQKSPSQLVSNPKRWAIWLSTMKNHGWGKEWYMRTSSRNLTCPEIFNLTSHKFPTRFTITNLVPAPKYWKRSRENSYSIQRGQSTSFDFTAFSCSSTLSKFRHRNIKITWKRVGRQNFTITVKQWWELLRHIFVSHFSSNCVQMVSLRFQNTFFFSESALTMFKFSHLPVSCLSWEKQRIGVGNGEWKVPRNLVQVWCPAHSFFVRRKTLVRAYIGIVFISKQTHCSIRSNTNKKTHHNNRTYKIHKCLDMVTC